MSEDESAIVPPDEAEPAREETPEVPETFQVCDADSANWVVRKIIEARAYKQRVAEWCLREQARADRQEEFFLFRYGAQLRDWATAQIRQQGGRRKSVNLPAGMVGFRTEPAKIIITDEPAVLAWAKAHCPQVIKIIEKLSKTELNAHVEQTGEVPEVGVSVQPEHERFYVK